MFLKKKSLVKPLSRSEEASSGGQAAPMAKGARIGPISAPSLAMDWRMALPVVSAAGLLALVVLAGESYAARGPRSDAIQLMEGDLCQTQGAQTQAGDQQARPQSRCLTADAQPAEIAEYFGVPESQIEMLPGEETLRFQIKGTSD